MGQCSMVVLVFSVSSLRFDIQTRTFDRYVPNLGSLDDKQTLIFLSNSKASEPVEHARKLPPSTHGRKRNLLKNKRIAFPRGKQFSPAFACSPALLSLRKIRIWSQSIGAPAILRCHISFCLLLTRQEQMMNMKLAISVESMDRF